jgi:hypothetical protein
MIYLSCPQCTSELEIDDGFRGGVCRCFSCGTLMTVPDDPEHQAPETLSRPDSPTEQKKRAAGGAPKSETYYTKSGRSLDVSGSAVPVASRSRRRFVVRAVMIGVFVAIALGIVATVIIGMNSMKTAKPEYVPEVEVNPFLMASPNFMGVPAGDKTVFMADASSAMRNYLDPVKIAMRQGVKSLKPDQQVQVVFWSEAAPIAFPDSLTAARQVPPAVLAGKLEEVYANGGLAAAPAFNRAMLGKPTAVTVVAGRFLPDAAELESIGQQVKKAGVILNVVLIDNTDADLKKIAADTGGKYVEISAGQLQEWYEKFRESPAGKDAK